LRERLSAAATKRAQEFSDEAFAERWRTVADRRGLLDLRSDPCR
jgi:ABC-type Fe2+-enterobactin transport system substrate-binding protein